MVSLLPGSSCHKIYDLYIRSYWVSAILANKKCLALLQGILLSINHALIHQVGETVNYELKTKNYKLFQRLFHIC